MGAASRDINSEDGARPWEPTGVPAEVRQGGHWPHLLQTPSLFYILFQAQEQLVAWSQSKHQENPIPGRASGPDEGNGTTNMC